MTKGTEGVIRVLQSKVTQEITVFCVFDDETQNITSHGWTEKLELLF